MQSVPCVYLTWGTCRYWPLIDDALRSAAFERGVRVRVMASWWQHSRRDLANYLRSLQALNGSTSAVWGDTVIVEVVSDLYRLLLVPVLHTLHVHVHVHVASAAYWLLSM